MEFSEINPYLRTSGYFEKWNYDNAADSIAYDLRMFAIFHGTAMLTLRDRTLCMPPDSLLILAPGEPYNFRCKDSSQPFDMFCISFDLTQEYRGSLRYRLPTFVPLFQPECLIDQKIRTGTRDISNLCLPLLLNDCPDLCEKVRQIYQLYRRQPACYAERCSGIIKEILFTALAEQQEPGTEKHPGGSLATAEQTMKYIETHFREPINEQSIAAALNFHPYYLTRLTVRYFGLTPYQYLLQCRTEEALSMLLNTDKPVGEIAASCGFVSPSHFSTVIRRKTGLTPGMIRKSAALPKDWATE